MNGLPYYQRYPRDFFEGTAGMDLEVKGAYGLLLDLIYLQGGRLIDDPRFIAGHLGCSVKKWNALRAAILKTGKVFVTDGYLGNDKADKLLDATKSYQSKQREKRLGKSKNKDLAETTVNPQFNLARALPEPEPEPYKEGGGGSARVREAGPSGQAEPSEDFTFRERILDAIGVDPVSGMTGRGGTMLGTQADMAEARRWIDAGLTEDEAVGVVREVMAGRSGPVPSRFSYFAQAMVRLVEAKAAGALSITPRRPGATDPPGESNEDMLRRILSQPHKAAH